MGIVFVKKNKCRSKLMQLVFVLGLVITAACSDGGSEKQSPVVPNETNRNLGWFGDDNMAKIQYSLNRNFAGANDSLPSEADLNVYFPPIGDQGNYGTCVAWASAYYAKTSVRAIEKGLSPQDLALPANQFSPRDLFTAIPDENKGADCGGTNFTFALDVLQQRGVATLETVPYVSLGNCSESNVESQWTREAGQYKIKSYRKVDPNVSSLKGYLSRNIPIVFGAKLSDNFMTWDSDNVLSSNTTYIRVDQHSYHALVIMGYDDSKGPNGAFRVINSWGEKWGDEGYIWIDYNFFLEEFCKNSLGESPLFVIENKDDDVAPPDDRDDRDTVIAGVDLVPWIFSDESVDDDYYSRERAITFDVYNIGSETASASESWSEYYLYYNAYDANDFGVLFYDEFNTTLNPGEYSCDEETQACTINMDIPSGGSLAERLFSDVAMQRTYRMPESISGYYYLVYIVDAEDKFQEKNEMNNLFYTYNMPIEIDSGVVYGPIFGSGNRSSLSLKGMSGEETSPFEFNNNVEANAETLKKSEFNSAVTKDNRNAYTPKEIMTFLKEKKRSGELDEKVDAYIQDNNAGDLNFE